MATIKGKELVIAALKRVAEVASKGNLTVNVGYGAEYAIYVHENMESKHPDTMLMAKGFVSSQPGQAKFLEQPSRQLQPIMTRMIRESLKAGKPMQAALMEAGEFLKEVSQGLVPVVSGELRDSAFVQVVMGEHS